MCVSSRVLFDFKSISLLLSFKGGLNCLFPCNAHPSSWCCIDEMRSSHILEIERRIVLSVRLPGRRCCCPLSLWLRLLLEGEDEGAQRMRGRFLSSKDMLIKHLPSLLFAWNHKDDQKEWWWRRVDARHPTTGWSRKKEVGLGSFLKEHRWKRRKEQKAWHEEVESWKQVCLRIRDFIHLKPETE